MRDPRRTDDDQVSDALDRLQNRLAELRARCLALLAEYDAMVDGEMESLSFAEAVKALRDEVIR
jgi:hypothetical protein